MSESIQITLAGKPYSITPFTVGQLEDLHVGVIQPDSGDPVENTHQFWKRNIDIIVVALSADHPEMTEPVVRKMKLGSVRAVNEAVGEILRYAGLAKGKTEESEGSPPGELQAAA